MNATPNGTSTHQPNSTDGRDTQGRFAKGNGGGPGNPFARKVAALRQALLDAVTPQDITDIATLLLFNAKAGDLASMKLLFQYVLGKPQAAVDPDTLDLNELLLLQSASLPAEAVQQFVARIPPQLALLILRELIPAITKRLGEAVQMPPQPEAPAATTAEPVPPPQAEKRRERRPSPNGDNGEAMAWSDEPSANGDNGSLAAIARLMRLFPPPEQDESA